MVLEKVRSGDDDWVGQHDASRDGGTMTERSSPSFERRSTSQARTCCYILVITSLTLMAASGIGGWQQAALISLGVLGAAAALLRKRYPYALLAVAWATTALATQVLLLPALFNLGVRRRNWRSLVAIGLTILILAGVAPRGESLVSIDGVDLDTWTSLASWLLNGIVVVIAPYLAGTAVAARRDLTSSYLLRAEHAEAERSARAAEAVLLERTRIAREAHDVLGHKLSLLTMQAGGLELNAHAGQRVVEEQAQLMRRSARAALDDLRSIIWSLETHEVLGAKCLERSLTPQDVLGIQRLVEESRVSGAVVELMTSKLTGPELMPEESSRAAYRVVQECLTNAHRHSPGAPVIISLAGAPDLGLVIEVRNAVTHPDASGDSPGNGGRGLPGLQERARSVGGELKASESDSVFIVRAELPWPIADAERTETKP